MSQTYFSKLDSREKVSKLIQLANSKGQVTVWIKGQSKKHILDVLEFDKDRVDIILNTKEIFFTKGTQLLCSFELKGLHFFANVTANTTASGYFTIEIHKELFKYEKRSSYRLLTFPIYEVYAKFDVSEIDQPSKVLSIKSRTGQTALFDSFLKLISEEEETNNQIIKCRVQDLSVSGMSLQIGEIESHFFSKDLVFKDVEIQFSGERIIIPEVKVIYIVDYISSDRKLKKFKVGLHFENLPSVVDDQLGKKINSLLREVDINSDFEKFSK